MCAGPGGGVVDVAVARGLGGTGAGGSLRQADTTKSAAAAYKISNGLMLRFKRRLLQDETTQSTFPPRRGWRELALLAIGLICIAFLFCTTRKLFWTYDDAFLLRVARSATVVDYAASPAFWRAMPSRMFVPGVLLWYEAGSRAGDAAQFHLLAVALLLIALVAIYIALRQWLDIAPSLTAIALIALGAPTVSVVLQLMAGHYLLAIALSAMSIAAYRRSPLLSAFLYLAAMLAKEIAIPLPLILLLLPERKRIAPHVFAVVLYVAWRRWMIGTFGGGYGWAITRDNFDDLVVAFPRALFDALTPPNLALAILVAIAVLAPIAWSLRKRRVAIAFIVAMIVAIAPILPVAREMQPRYAFVAWIVLATFAAIALRATPILAALVVLVVAIAQRVEWRDVYTRDARMSAEARFAIDGPRDALLRAPTTPPAAMNELLAMRSNAGLVAFYDDLYLCTQRDARRVFEFDAQRNAIVDITPHIASLAQKHCNAIRDTAPLRAHFRFDGDTLHWTFGPYTRGRWHVVFANGQQSFEVPREDAFILGEIPAIALRIRYDAPEGWTTYSPEIAMDFTKRRDFTFTR